MKTKIKNEQEIEEIKKEIVRLIEPKDLKQDGQGGKATFEFTWLNADPMKLLADSEEHQLKLINILEGIPEESAIYVDILRVTDEFNSGRNHLLKMGLSNEEGNISIICKVKYDYTYGTEKILRLANDIFQYIFENYQEYTKEKFNEIMVRTKIRGLERQIPIILSQYQKGNCPID